jgi:CelD/BcsL family acetyltransferase involved in cellulose biosynthesis
LLNQLSKRNRKNLFSKVRKLENNHQVTYKMYYGGITKEHYDFLIDTFYKLFDRRFKEKRIYNKNLINWKYYHELIYPMILDKKASLYVIYDQDKPIDITLNFHLGHIVFSFMHTYDIDYSNFNMGDISMLKHLDWCFGHQIALFDLSIGETGQKIKWCNYSYDFKYHIFYNPKSLNSNILTLIICLKLKLKQFLRDRNIIGKLFQYDKFFYKRRAKKLKNFNWRKGQG